jgi:hypothetical protein
MRGFFIHEWVHTDRKGGRRCPKVPYGLERMLKVELCDPFVCSFASDRSGADHCT